MTRRKLWRCSWKVEVFGEDLAVGRGRGGKRGRRGKTLMQLIVVSLVRWGRRLIEHRVHCQFCVKWVFTPSHAQLALHGFLSGLGAFSDIHYRVSPALTLFICDHSELL